MLSNLFQSIKSGSAVLTANIRLSRHIRLEYDRFMKDHGETVWDTPVIMPFPAWLESLWNESRPDKPLISKAGSSVLWERIASSDRLPAGRTLVFRKGIAGIALDAYRLMKDYNLEFPADDIYLTEEASALRRWAKIYKERLNKLGFADRGSLAERLTEAIGMGCIPLPGNIVAAGFDEITPSLKGVMAAIIERGTTVSFWPAEPGGHPDDTFMRQAAGRITVRSYKDEPEEVTTAARWIRETYRPGMRIGIIVPELGRYRDIIKREFSAELDPGSVLPGSGGRKLFNISLGGSLSSEPIVRAALNIISTGARRYDVKMVSSILLSPYIAMNEDEHIEMARLDARLREIGWQEVSLYEVRNLAMRHGTKLAVFAERLSRWMGMLDSGGRMPPSGWAEHFNNLLRVIKWPSPRTVLTGPEHQALESFSGALSSFAGLDDITGGMERGEAAMHLIRIADETVYQPLTPESPIQVLGLLESAGIFFDQMIILGAHEDALPGQPSPNPFIPFLQQRKHNLPHSSHDRELSFSKTVIARLLTGAKNLIVSYPVRLGEKEMKVSPLISIYERAEQKDITISGNSLRDAVSKSGRFEELEGIEQIPVRPGETEWIKGGTAVLRDQSACPFRAFAVHRLKASGLALPEPGLAAHERGTILHTVIKRLWQKIGDSEGLKEAISGGTLDGVISGCISKALEGANISRPFASKFLDIEKKRLQVLIREWLDLELQRPPFRVGDLEERREIVLGELKISGYIDRIDISNSGGRIVIDYKTGICDISDWDTGRPREPQMMLYSMTGDFDAVAFGRVSKGGCALAGVSRKEGILPGQKVKNSAEWRDMMKSWEEVIMGLADDFLKGKAAVDPRDFGTDRSACRFCELPTLCRIFEYGGA